MEIKGLTNTTLNDYPGVVATTIHLGGCDFCCPYCYSRSLVVQPERTASVSEEQVFEFLSDRRIALEGVCISGGEPLIQPDLKEFLRKLRNMDYKIKLDTNGYNPVELNHILKEGLVDYVAMDVKSSVSNYAMAAGCPNIEINRVRLSVDILKDSQIDYEFRTTVVKDLHNLEEMVAIGQWLKGAKAYYLQPYIETEDVIMPVFSGYSKEEMKDLAELMRQYVPNTHVRGYEG